MRRLTERAEEVVNVMLGGADRGGMDGDEREALERALAPETRSAKRAGVTDDMCGEALLCAEPAVWEVLSMADFKPIGKEQRPVRRVCAAHLHGVLGDCQLVRKVNGEWRRRS